MEVVITGSSGFIGKNLISYFLGLSIGTVPIYRDDLAQRKFGKMEKGDAIIHLAGKAHDLKNITRPEEYYDVNYELTKDLYNAFLKSNAKKFIFISSVKASADQVEDILNERDIPEPKTHYGKSKLMAEEYIQSQPLPVGKSFYILRPCMIHGPGNKGNLNLLYKLISKALFFTS